MKFFVSEFVISGIDCSYNLGLNTLKELTE